MNLNNTLLIIIGVIGLGLSLLWFTSYAIFSMTPGTPDGLKQAKEIMKISALLVYFFGAMIAFGIYKNWRG
jgi:hypothetical protein